MKNGFDVFCKLIGVALFAIGSWHGIVDQNYNQACFELLLSYSCTRD